MKSQFEAKTIVPGVYLMQDEIGNYLRDSKRRLLWNMPEPYGYAEHKSGSAGTFYVDQSGIKHKMPGFGKKIKIPLYRGISARMANYIRGQKKRLEQGKRIYS